MPRELFTAERHQRSHQAAPTGIQQPKNWDVEMMQVLKTLSRLEEKVEKLSSALPDPSLIRAMPAPEPVSAQEHECLEKSRMELAGMYAAPEDKRLNSAADELVAVIQTTEAATEEILSACEIIDTISHNISVENPGQMIISHENMTHIQECVIRIYQAATFQDLTGQRITKVSRILADIEQRINGLAGTLGLASAHLINAARVTEKSADILDEKKLLNGPAKCGQGISQSDIDLMFNDF